MAVPGSSMGRPNGTLPALRAYAEILGKHLRPGAVLTPQEFRLAILKVFRATSSKVRDDVTDLLTDTGVFEPVTSDRGAASPLVRAWIYTGHLADAKDLWDPSDGLASEEEEAAA
jgi:hypothetical protein